MAANPENMQGVSMISMLIGTLLLSSMLVGTLNLTSFIKTGPNSDKKYQYVNELSALGEMLSERIAIGGGAVSEEDASKGIQLCALSTSGEDCGTYVDQVSNFCMAFPTRKGQGASSSIDVLGIRLLSGVMQERTASNVDLGVFDFKSFCSNALSWHALNNANDFVISSIRLCKFNTAAISDLNKDFETDCPSVLQLDMQSNVFWLTLIKGQIKNNEKSDLSNVNLNPLFNTTKVTTL